MNSDRPARIFQPWHGAVLVVAAIALAYSNTFNVPFIYDDNWNIIDNPCVHSLWPVGNIFSGCPSGIAGRPLAVLSFALNYAVRGESVTGYHVVNLSIHILAALALMGIVRRTFHSFLGWTGRASLGIALASALAWGLHPLCTQAVTYITQRIESLTGLLYLLTLYLAIRGWQSVRPGLWHWGAIAAFIAAVGVKEVIVTAPVMVFLYDWIFVSQGVKNSFKRSPILYCGFVAGWILLAILVQSGETAEFARASGGEASPWRYTLVQPLAMAHYLKLAVWPTSLCFDYGFLGEGAHGWAQAGAARILPAAIFLGVIGGLSAILAWSRKPVGFLGVWFFVVLSPTSSIVRLHIPAEEHRMYLPLAGLVVLSIAGIATYVRSVPNHRWKSVMGALCVGVFLGVTLCLGATTYARNQVYQSRISLWVDTTNKVPSNSQAALNLGSAMVDAGYLVEGVMWYETALLRQPNNAKLHENMGVALSSMGQVQKAESHYETALDLDPTRPKSHCNIGVLLAQQGEVDQAIEHFRQAVDLNPDYVDALSNLGYAYLTVGKFQDARILLERALALEPGSPLILANIRALKKAENQPSQQDIPTI